MPVFVRALQLSVFLFLLTIGLDSYLAPDARLAFDRMEFFATVKSHLPWFGVMFGGIYLALYSRFSSQWTYLAGLYNTLMHIECQDPRALLTGPKLTRRAMAWAAFIEDAVTLHLAAKASFAHSIRALLLEDSIRSVVVDWSKDDPATYEKLRRHFSFDQQTPSLPAAPPPTVSP